MTHLEALTAELRRHGVTEWTVDTSHPHPRLYFTWQGRRRFVVYPSSTSDARRGAVNAVTTLRRLLGVRRIKTPTSARKTRVKAPDRLPPPPTQITVRPDPWAVLRTLVSAAGDEPVD